MKNVVKKSVSVFLAFVVVLGLFMSQTVSFVHADEGTWIYVDGQNGSDSNDGKTAGTAVKSWDKAKALLGCAEGGIYVVGTVDASGVISTKMPSVQSVKRTSNVVMFNVGSEATFANIKVEGGAFDSPVIKPSKNAKLNFLSGAVFYKTGYLEDPKENEKNSSPDFPMGVPDNLTGGCVVLLEEGVNILIDGAEFTENPGKAIFYAPMIGGSSGKRDVKLFMKSGRVTKNQGFFYYNEIQGVVNYVYIYNALIRNNDASQSGTRYISYKNRTGVVYVCDMGQMFFNSTDGAAIFDNKAHDVIYIDGESLTGSPTINLGDAKMLGGGSANWQHGEVDDSYDLPDGGRRDQHYDVFDAKPLEADKAAAIQKATSIFEDNKSILIDSNGKVFFGKGDETVPPTPTVPVEQGCDDTPTTPTTTPKVVDTTAKINDKAEEVELNEGEEGTMTDVVKFEGLEDGKTYKVVSTLFKDGEKFDEATAEVTSKDASKTITFTKKITAEGKYTIKTELMLGDTVVDTHNAGLDVASETVKVTVKKPEKPEEKPEDKPEEKPEPKEEPKETPKETPKNDGSKLPPPNVPSTGRTVTPRTTTPSNSTPPPQLPTTGPQVVAPPTGDTNNAVLWILIGVFAALVATLTLRFKTRR